MNAYTHRAPYVRNGKAYELQTWYTDGKRISHTPHDVQGQRSRSQGHMIRLSRVGPMAHKSKTNSRSVIKIVKRVPRDTCYIAHQSQCQKVKVQGHRLTNADTQNAPYIPNGKA